jgi:crotonobetainyl-CoA:carnitine CoA-transferase CaiB-like acyl-CoA transferase
MGFDLYRTKDGRLFLPTGAYPRMLEHMCTFLGCSPDRDRIAKAVSQWDSEELDKAAAEAGVVYAIVRTPEEWAVHPQGKYLADKPLVEIIKIGDSDPEPFTPAARPLSGLRVLAATHVIAGNVMARTLAEHGAEVLQIAHPEEFENEGLMQDPCAGFTSSAWLDLAQPEGLRRAYELAAGADVFVENYRGRKIADLGMSPEELAARRPGIIYASGKAFSHDGPWANRGGMDMEALCVTGFTTEEGTPEQPKFPPTKVMNDYIAGYIGAAGIQAALIRRAKEGGSYHVRVNLARCAMWFMSLGTFDKDAPVPTGEQHHLLAPDTITAQTPYGELVRLAPPVQFSETKPYWRDPVLVVRGSSKPAWTS